MIFAISPDKLIPCFDCQTKDHIEGCYDGQLMSITVYCTRCGCRVEVKTKSTFLNKGDKFVEEWNQLQREEEKAWVSEPFGTSLRQAVLVAESFESLHLNKPYKEAAEDKAKVRNRKLQRARWN